MREVIGEFKEGLARPLRPDMPLSTILMIFVLFLVVAFIVFDALKLVQQWAAKAAEISA